MDISLEAQSSYRVEVSGWDASENFFVEKTGLEWNRDDEKDILLRSVLRAGSVVFVRLLQPFANPNVNNFPIAYQALKVFPQDASGRSRVCLEQLRPRESHRNAGRTVGDSTVKVA